MNILVIDTSANLCAACVFDTNTEVELGRSVRDLGKGHAEQLMDVIGEALAHAGIGYPDLGMIGVSVGPGSFTGIRVGVAAARGLALALAVPSVGVTTLDALAFEANAAHPGMPVFAALDARREQIYLAGYDAHGAKTSGPAIVGLADAGAATDAQTVLTGSAAVMIRDAAGGKLTIASTAPTADIATYALLAARHGPSVEAPKPLYLRDADAKPQQGFAVARSDP